MLAVGLTGGIGAGKSAVADLLAEKGAVLIDADVVAREVVAPGMPANRALVERFGPAILDRDGGIDRPALARVAFVDDTSVADLNAITHPAIGIEMLDRLRALSESPDADRTIVLLAIPLLKPLHRESMNLDLVVVVDCPVDVALARLIEQRGMERADAEARLRAQISREERCREADIVVVNDGDLQHLAREVEGLWRRLEAARDAKAAAA